MKLNFEVKPAKYSSFRIFSNKMIHTSSQTYEDKSKGSDVRRAPRDVLSVSLAALPNTVLEELVY